MRTGLICAAATALTLAQPAGAQTVCEAIWHDAARDRDVPVRIRMPQGAGRVPVVLFSHGLGGSLDAGTDWARAWASHGLAVIHVQHPGSDVEVVRSAGRAGLRDAMAGGQLIARARDVRFVIDELERRPREGACDLARIDRGRIGMAGHSFGSQTTMAVSGQSYPRVGPALRDPRIRAAIALSPAPPRDADEAQVRSAFAGIAIPMMMLTGTEDGGQLGMVMSPADRQQPFRFVAPGGKYLLVFGGADHANFGGNLRRRPSENDRRVTAVVQAATTAFWRATLLDDPAGAAELAPLGAIERSLGPADRIERR